jgi:ABC-type phosphate transport system permease subunit
MGAYFKADVALVLAIAMMVTASFHFMRSASGRKPDNKAFEAYFALCNMFDNVLHFFCILSVFAFGYTYGLMEAVKLLIVCLVLPIIGMLFAAIMGTHNWNRTASLIALPLGVLCALYIFPRLNWFGLL